MRFVGGIHVTVRNPVTVAREKKIWECANCGRRYRMGSTDHGRCPLCGVSTKRMEKS